MQREMLARRQSVSHKNGDHFQSGANDLTQGGPAIVEFYDEGCVTYK
jgi:hypothetical protein